MSPGGIGLALFSAMVPSVWANTTEPDYNLSTVATSGGSSENIETYSVEEESSSPFMTDIGTGILARLANPPYDSSLLEEAVATPTYDAVKENISYNDQSVGSFLTFLWAAMVFFCIITIVNTLQRCAVCCTGEYKHRVTPSYMAVFVFLFVVLLILFLLMTVLLVSLVSTRDSMVDSVKEKVPAVLASTFQGLRGFVNLTVAQIAQNRRTARMPKVGNVLGDGFDTAFKSFVASSAMADVRIPLHHNALSAEAKFLNGNRANTTIFLNKWSDLRNKNSDPKINKTVIKKVLLPMIPSYYNRFVTDLVNIAMQPTGNTVAGRCSLLRALLKSFMDVVCYTYVLEFVGYWASLLLAVFLAMLVIPFCFMLAKYFFCTQRLIHVLRRPRKSRKGMAAHSLSESLEREQTPEQYGQVHPLARLLQMFAGSELPPGTSRRIVAMSTKNTSVLPTLGPPIHQMASFSSRVTQTPKRLHAVHSSTSIIATGGGVPVVAGIPVASVGAVVAAQPAAPSIIHSHSVAAPVGHVASSSVHRTNSLTLVQPHYHSRLCTNVASSSHQSLVPPVQAPLMYGAPVPMALPQSQPSFVVKPMPAVCVPVQASVPVQAGIPVQASLPSTRLLTRTTAASSGSQLNLVAPPAASMMAVAQPSTVVYRQAYPATYALPSRVSVAPSLAVAPVYAPRRRTVSVHSVSSSSSSGSLRAVRVPRRTVAFARPQRTLSAHSMTTHMHRRL
ncbi:uncharacterized protein [Dermacentor albipictus]|uniref:uncharacterized protein isoform X2 n=1 Tax=Dermacentor albipictus TaxID=60249 RepID=UPI0031FE2C06